MGTWIFFVAFGFISFGEKCYFISRTACSLASSALCAHWLMHVCVFILNPGAALYCTDGASSSPLYLLILVGWGMIAAFPTCALKTSPAICSKLLIVVQEKEKRKQNIIEPVCFPLKKQQQQLTNNDKSPDFDYIQDSMQSYYLHLRMFGRRFSKISVLQRFQIWELKINLDLVKRKAGSFPYLAATPRGFLLFLCFLDSIFVFQGWLW